MIPTKMIVAPRSTSNQPNGERPSTNNQPIPTNKGTSVRPKALYPQNAHHPVVTVT